MTMKTVGILVLGGGHSLGAIAFAGVLGMAMPVAAEERMWVSVDDNIRRTCPSVDCGAVGRFYRGESVLVYETSDGWARVSRYYDAGCADGASSFVDSGEAACTAENGIRDGQFAEWLRAEFLSDVRAGRSG